MRIIEPCGPRCVAEDPLLDTVDGREHDNCPDPACCAGCEMDRDLIQTTEGGFCEPCLNQQRGWIAA